MGKLKKFVESEEAMEKFIADYRISSIVGLRYCEEGEWRFRREEGEVVIPIIAFLEGGMRSALALNSGGPVLPTFDGVMII